ncbi:methyltransferase domain-containing protein [Microbacterium sp. APC 3901]|uniref:methyltransferase domain-containing protein n=1 Tax=Microbacterium sp. APC 3901 TaxID=3035192 RepID=UPI0025B58677|nr:methyltransferase domain-containing protein [Microbacterium sp. APC 3901]MDN3444932.1 methyltransferase domain-containing protein [Microbacterium sp. APC 3901]
MRHDLSMRATEARELMDDPDADIGMLEQTYRRFRLVNALVSRPGLLHRREILPRARRGPLRILDIGAGGGDVCRMIAARLRRAGLDAEITALDADERAIRWAADHDDGAGIRYRCAFAAELVAEGEQFDVVFSNHLLHHLTGAELDGLLHDSAALVGVGGIVVHRDIARTRVAYALYDAATWALSGTLFRGSFIREDGLISIRRSYTRRELASLVPSGWTVRFGLPSRLELRREPESAS